MAELQFFTGTMDSGKSTLALQTNHNRAQRGLVGRIFTSLDRAGTAMLSSRLGLQHDAIEVDPAFHFWRYVVDELTRGARVDYLICDEAQFYTRDQVDELTAFRSELFPGSARFVELADRTHVLQVEAMCWCGRRATHNARTEDGVMVVEGEVIVVGDVEQSGAEAVSSDDAVPEVAYEVLCRMHHRRRMTAARAHAVALGAEPLPFG
mgnify:CR=1 FL=1